MAVVVAVVVVVLMMVTIEKTVSLACVISTFICANCSQEDD